MSDLSKRNITTLNGIGQKRAESFRTLGVYTISDLLNFYPRTYEDRTTIKKIAEIKDGDTVCVRGRAVSHLKENRACIFCVLIQAMFRAFQEHCLLRPKLLKLYFFV